MNVKIYLFFLSQAAAAEVYNSIPPRLSKAHLVRTSSIDVAP